MNERGESGELDDADEATIWAGRLRAWPASEPEATVAASPEGDADDATRLGERRTPSPVPPVDEGADDATVLGRRSPVDDTVLGARGPADAPTDATVIAPRPAAPPPSEATELRPTTRRAAASRDATRPEPGGRARVPDAEQREIYRPRAAQPVMAVRRAPAAPPPSGTPLPEPEAVQRSVRRRRRRLLTAAAVTVVIIVAAAVAVAVLAFL